MIADFDDVIFVVDMAGIVAFSISGAMIAIKEETDLFGVILLGLITAMGGGVMRDTLLGLVPSSNFFNYPNIILSVVTSLLVFVLAYRQRKYYLSHTREIENITNIVDSLGLGLFSIYGVNMTMAAGYKTNLFLLVFMGVMTGAGGGLIRDVIVKRIPMIFSKHIYAIASIIGCLTYIFLLRASIENGIAMSVSIMCVVFIRMVATIKELDLPKVEKL
ncbi:MAG: trimeric intracellular cation channel family protein [Lachnospiraceae bacterium]|nr:trimeric intracellular cation channel family protein [Lachnospiraceae bacterium]